MSQALFTAYGRMAKKNNPAWFKKQHNLLQQLKNERLKDTSLLQEVFALFTNTTGKRPVSLNSNRSNDTQINDRRLFIAVVLYLYDQVWMHGFTGRMASGVRKGMAEAMNANEVWISQVADSVRFEYFHIDELQMQVNLIAYCIRMQGKHLA